LDFAQPRYGMLKAMAREYDKKRELDPWADLEEAGY